MQARIRIIMILVTAILGTTISPLAGYASVSQSVAHAPVTLAAASTTAPLPEEYEVEVVQKLNNGPGKILVDRNIPVTSTMTAQQAVAIATSPVHGGTQSETGLLDVTIWVRRKQLHIFYWVTLWQYNEEASWSWSWMGTHTVAVHYTTAWADHLGPYQETRGPAQWVRTYFSYESGRTKSGYIADVKQEISYCPPIEGCGDSKVAHDYIHMHDDGTYVWDATYS